MAPHVTSDSALGGDRLSVGDVGDLAESYMFHAESAFSFIRHERPLVANPRDRLRQASRGAL